MRILHLKWLSAFYIFDENDKNVKYEIGVYHISLYLHFTRMT